MSISLILDNNGIIQRSKDAREQYGQARENEQQQLDDVSNWIEDQTTVINWEELIEDFKKNPNKYKHPEQKETNKNIGIGTDGKTVNMDLWHYKVDSDRTGIIMNDGTTSAKYYPGYDNANITAEGTIIGKMPQFIYDDETDKVYPVTSLAGTFYGCTNLVIAPTIPSSVKYMNHTFYDCKNLSATPEIPSGVEDMNRTFCGCTNLKKATKIPSGVKSLEFTFSSCKKLSIAPEISYGVREMGNTFNGCESLEVAPEIPESVERMESTFSYCTNLATAPTIPSSVTYMGSTFRLCKNLTEAPEIPESVTYMYGIFNGCEKLKTAPIILSNVTCIENAFKGCTNLTGNLIINANTTSYNNCLTNAATADDANLIVSGSSTVLDKIIATKSDNSHITKGN